MSRIFRRTAAAAAIMSMIAAAGGTGCEDQSPATVPAVGPTAPARRPPYDADVFDRHRQLYYATCLPMAVELVLILTGRESPLFYELQVDARYCDGRRIGDFDGRRIGGLTFHQQLWDGEGFFFFSMTDFEQVVDREFAAHRYVIVGLPVGADDGFEDRPMDSLFGFPGSTTSASIWGVPRHAYVIVGHTADGDYLAVSKAGQRMVCVSDVKARVRAMAGTAVLTYTADAGQGAAAPPNRPSSPAPLASAGGV